MMVFLFSDLRWRITDTKIETDVGAGHESHR